MWAAIAGTQRACDSISTAIGPSAQYTITYGSNGTDPYGPYTEVGLFDNAGNLWAHAAINEYLASGQTLTIQWMVVMVADTTNPNAVMTNFGLTTVTNWLAAQSNTTSAPPPTQIQLGTGSGTVAVTDTALWTATSGTTKRCDYIQLSATTNIQYCVTYLGTDPTGNFTEVGLFDSLGNLWLHGTLSNANKTGSLLLSTMLQVGISID